MPYTHNGWICRSGFPKPIPVTEAEPEPGPVNNPVNDDDDFSISQMEGMNDNETTAPEIPQPVPLDEDVDSELLLKRERQCDDSRLPKHCTEDCFLSTKARQMIVAINTERLLIQLPELHYNDHLCYIARDIIKERQLPKNWQEVASHYCYPDGKVWGWLGTSRITVGELVETLLQPIRDQKYEMETSEGGTCTVGSIEAGDCPTDKEVLLDEDLKDIAIYTQDDGQTSGMWHYAIVLGYSDIEGCTRPIKQNKA